MTGKRRRPLYERRTSPDNRRVFIATDLHYYVLAALGISGQQTQLTPSERQALVAVASHWNLKNPICTATTGRLAKLVGCGPRHCTRLLAKLESEGIIQRTVIEWDDGSFSREIRPSRRLQRRALEFAEAYRSQFTEVDDVGALFGEIPAEYRDIIER